MYKPDTHRMIKTFLFMVIFLLTGKGYSQENDVQSVRLMFYNVENLFDIFDDTLKNDNEFLPDGLKRWNLTRYKRKINMLFKTIVSAGTWSPPCMVALSEVENRKVLEDLVYGTYLSKYNYKIIHEESPDQRGIDVCMIYRGDYVKVADYRYWIPPDGKSEGFLSRSILYVKFVIRTDTVHVFVNHWPSRRGGVLAGEENRKRIASMIRMKTDSIMNISHAGAKIIMIGDFNSTPDDMEIRSLTIPSNTGSVMMNLSERLSDTGLGTYRYQGTWEMIDQIIVSETLLTAENGLFTDEEMINIFRPEFLLEKDPKYPGFSPHSTYRGYKYQGGYSDHLPVLLDLKFR